MCKTHSSSSYYATSLWLMLYVMYVVKYASQNMFCKTTSSHLENQKKKPVNICDFVHECVMPIKASGV